MNHGFAFRRVSIPFSYRYRATVVRKWFGRDKNLIMSNQIVAGIVQSSPVFMDLEASLVKATRLIADAAGKGATLVAFGETWLAG
jgi:hypothetical protein